MKKEISTLFITFFSILLLNSCKSNTNSDPLTKESLPQINNSIEGKILAGYQGWFNAERRWFKIEMETLWQQR